LILRQIAARGRRYTHAAAAARSADETAEESAAETAEATRAADHDRRSAASAHHRSGSRQRHRGHGKLLHFHALLPAIAGDQLPGRLALVSDDVLDVLDPARDHAAHGLGILDRLGDLHVLDRLEVAHLCRRGFGDVDRAAYGDRAACRDGGQFRQGHSYRHRRSLSFDG
jgi:hypothetical protein